MHNRLHLPCVSVDAAGIQAVSDGLASVVGIVGQQHDRHALFLEPGGVPGRQL